MVIFPKKGGVEIPPSHETGQWEPLVRRIMNAAGPELARLRNRMTLTGQFDRWTRPLLPLAAALILVFGSILALAGVKEASPELAEAPLMAEVLVPEPLSLWLEAGVKFSLAELVEALEEGER